MPSWIRPSSCALTALVLLTPLRAANLDGSSPEVGDAEAARLYRDANDYVTNVVEGKYSYEYMQFFWQKRAESFIERAQRVYPDSPTAKALRAGQLKVGPFEVDYFKQRVLPRLEEKRTYTVDGVTCATFLYNRDMRRSDDERLKALDGIIEVLMRQNRWGEAADFPVGTHRPRLLHDMFRIAAFYDVPEEVSRLKREVKPAEQAAAGFVPLEAESMVLLGKPRTDLLRFVRAHPEDEVKLAILEGMVDREVQIQRAAALKTAIVDTIQTTHYDLRNLKVRDNVGAIAGQFFPDGNPQAESLLLAYRAALGTRPPADAPLVAHLAYIEYLGAFEKFDEVESYGPGLSDDFRQDADLKVIEVYAAGGRLADAERHRAAYAAGGRAQSDAALFAQFRGQLECNDPVLTVHEKTFAELPTVDPCVLAQAIMEEGLRPNRSIRGAKPWDAVVYKFDPGFENLPLPLSKAVGAAASATNPY